MYASKEILFFFSALGAFNGVLLAIYFVFIAKRKGKSSYFLALLLLMLSIRVIKSIFFYFNPQQTNTFIQIGLSACVLIGPFLFLYLKTIISEKRTNWPIHIFPYIAVITILGIFYPYFEHRALWSGWIVRAIYLQWLIYILMSAKYVHPILKKIRNRVKLENMDVWLMSIFTGVLLNWLAYSTVAYTSYIVGALTFSFLFYLILLLVIFRNLRQSAFYQEKERYKNKAISRENIQKIEHMLPSIIAKELYLNPNLTLDETAKELRISRHLLSQYLNEKLNQSFTSFINTYRIEKAKELLQTKGNYSVESLGYESGFNSKSSFFVAFKKTTGKTPAEFQKALVTGSNL